MTTMRITRDDEPVVVHLDWMTSDSVVYGLLATTREGIAVTLTADEENEALELAYGCEPAPEY